MNRSSLIQSQQWLISILAIIVLFFDTTCISAAQAEILPRLSVKRPPFLGEPAKFSEPVSEDLQTFYYNQTLDHFNYRPESYTTFEQRYVMNFKYWGGASASAPIFVYLGAEADLDSDMSVVGFLNDNAHQFKALQVYIEHRYYGKSIPFGLTQEEALENANIRGYFSSAQAIADYAEVIIYIKKKLFAENSPVIVVGASYGGMLASWFRLKYPHVTLGALASSAPILYFEDITPQNGYYSVVTKDFREASESCYKTIRESWSEIDRVAAEPNGLSVLSKKFKTCNQLNNSDELKDYLRILYAVAAQYNDPPLYPVTMVCGGIDGAPKGSDILSRIYAGLVAYEGNMSCYYTHIIDDSQTIRGWGWQVHMCNKLASTSRHVRVGLADPSDVPRCDICENAPTFFYCEIDGTSLCLQCDMIVHVGGKRTHGRYLLLRQRVEFPGDKSGNLEDPALQPTEPACMQKCSEMVIPIGSGDNDSMFPPAPFNLTTFSRDCTSLYGVPPRPHWVTTYYGGHDIELILRRFANNIIFSNGLRDPYSSGGVLKNISQTVLAINTVNGSHCLDILFATSTDPDWLVMQRKAEVEIIESWIAQYYVDFHAMKK